MDYYKLLNLDNNASDEEIEASFKALLNTYDPNVNYSSYAIRKYRKIKQAYELFLLDKNALFMDTKKVEPKVEEVEVFDYDAYYNNLNTDSYNWINERSPKEVNNNIDVSSLCEDRPIIRVSYLEYLLKARITRKVTVATYVYGNDKCSHCDSEGKLDYHNETTICPFCNGVGKEATRYYKEEEISFDLAKLNDSKGIYLNGIYYQFEVEPCNVKETSKAIELEYVLSREEARNGVHLSINSSEGIINIDSDDYEPISFEYDSKAINIKFIKQMYTGEDIYRNIFIPASYFHKTVYVDPTSGAYNKDNKEGLYALTLNDLQGQVRLDKQGEDGVFGGDKGDLYLNYYVCHNIKDGIVDKQVEYKDTSMWYNILGGEGNSGFKGKNHIVYNKDKIVILSGQSSKKIRVNELLWPTILMYVIWAILFVLLLAIKVTEKNLLTMVIVIGVYSLFANILFNLKVGGGKR